MKEKIIVNPSNYRAKIENNEAQIYQFEPGNYKLNRTLVLGKRSMLTALDKNEKPNFEVDLNINRPAIHILNNMSFITHLKFSDNDMRCDIIRNDAHNTRIMNNEFNGCKTAIISGGDDTKIYSNVINYFTQDGIQFSGQRTKIHDNIIQDLIQIEGTDGHHHDAIQAWSGDPSTALNAKDRYLAKYQLCDAEIVGNIITSCTDLGRSQQGALQGITAFDGWMSGWLIANNYINTHSTIHGITILGAIASDNNDFRIYDNEVYLQSGKITPEIHIKPARVWNGKAWSNVDNESFDENIKKIVDYNTDCKNNNCSINNSF